MGRLKKYVTEEEKLNVKRTRAKKYYWDNKQDQDEKQPNITPLLPPIIKLPHLNLTNIIH